MPVYENYARIDNNRIIIRHSVKDGWGKRGWPPRLAVEFGEYILSLAEEAMKADPRVIALTEFLEGLDEDCYTSEHIALALHKAGYRKRS